MHPPPGCCTEEEKETFWEQMAHELSATLEGEREIVGGYLNGCIEGVEGITRRTGKYSGHGNDFRFSHS